MKAIDPIRDKKKIEDRKVYLRGENLRDYALFVVGINIKLIASELLMTIKLLIAINTNYILKP